MTVVLTRDEPADLAPSRLPGVFFHRVEADMNHGIVLELGTVPAAGSIPDLSTLKRGTIARALRKGRDLKKRAHHGHVQRLAEPAGTAEQRDGVSTVENVGDEHGLVDEHVGLERHGKTVTADGQHLAPATVDDVTRFFIVRRHVLTFFRCSMLDARC